MSTLDDIPKPLTKLIRLIMRGFYNIEQKLIVDMLVRRRETREDDLIEVLKLERKHLRSLLQQMRQDKFINFRMMMETDDDGKSTRRNYYSINYRMFVNVVKYKIDHVRRKLETEERDLTSRASFICQSCSKTFTDLEIGQIFDPNRLQFRCSYCDGVVEEDPNVRPKADSRLVMARFNDQMKPIYELLKETEGIKWSINEADRNNLMTGATSVGATNKNNSNHLGQNNTAAGLTNGSSSSDQQNLGQLINVNQQEQYPVTIVGLDEKDKQQQDQEAKNRATIINPEVEALLLREESLVNSASHGAIVQESSHDDDIIMTTNDEDCQLMINVGCTKVPIDKISEEHIELMTKQQRDDYVRLMQHIYSLVFG
uniref:General transcription factor IIE subunit 1 n=1 Tax=Aceria tosichella TaxID=561515 RepID=A0A6G1SIW0_9ACAR